MSAIKWHCQKEDGNYAICAEKMHDGRRFVASHLISHIEWRYISCQMTALESAIMRMTRAIDEATK